MWTKRKLTFGTAILGDPGVSSEITGEIRRRAANLWLYNHTEFAIDKWRRTVPMKS